MTIAATAPPAIIAAADMLAASAAWIALVGSGNEVSSIYYPEYDEQDVVLPAAVLFPGVRTKKKFITGAPGLDGGSMILVIHVPLTMTDYELETAAEAILADLFSNDTGLALQDGNVGPTENPRPGERAADDTVAPTAPVEQAARSISINLEYGLTA